VLSLFPGIGLLDMAFEEAGFCVVRGPDLLWGGDVRRFHPPAGRFDGVIGGPPCQLFSQLKYLVPSAGEKHGNMIPEFERVVSEARPGWFLMENVPRAPEPVVADYVVRSMVLNNRWLGEVQERVRRFSFGTPHGATLRVEVAALDNIDYRQAVTSSLRAVPVKLNANGRPKRTYTEDGRRHGPGQGRRAGLADMLEHQGSPAPDRWRTEQDDNSKRGALMEGNETVAKFQQAIDREWRDTFAIATGYYPANHHDARLRARPLAVERSDAADRIRDLERRQA
jgi:DNA (cytosine-5)-methyltransferase 1